MDGVNQKFNFRDLTQSMFVKYIGMILIRKKLILEIKLCENVKNSITNNGNISFFYFLVN
jgi:hypothetical protein